MHKVGCPVDGVQNPGGLVGEESVSRSRRMRLFSDEGVGGKSSTQLRGDEVFDSLIGDSNELSERHTALASEKEALLSKRGRGITTPKKLTSTAFFFSLKPEARSSKRA